MKQHPLGRKSVVAMIRKGTHNVNFAHDVPTEFQSDPEIAQLAIEHNCEVDLAALPSALHDNREVMLALAIRSFWSAPDVPPALLDDDDFVRDFLGRNPQSYAFVSERLRATRALAMAAVANPSSNNLKHVPDELRRDPELLRAALAGHTQAYLHVPDELKADPELVALAVKTSKGDSLVLESFPEQYRGDRDIALKMVSQNGLGFQYVTNQLLDDKEVLFAALDADLRSVQYASPRLRADPEVVRRVASSSDCSYAYRYLDDKARNESSIVALALANGAQLQEVAEHWRDDDAMVRVALSRLGINYREVSGRLKQDRDLTLLAAQDHTRGVTWGFDLSWVPEALQQDREIVRNAVRSENKNAAHLHPALLADHDFVRELMAINEDILQHLPASTQRALASAIVRTSAHRGRRIAVDCVPDTGYVRGNRRTVDAVHVEEEGRRRLRVGNFPVVTYEASGPVGSYLSQRFENAIVLCGDFVFLVQRNSGNTTFTSNPPKWCRDPDWEPDERDLYHYVYLIDLQRAGAAALELADLCAVASELYAGLEANLPRGASAFASSRDYRMAMTLLQQPATPAMAPYERDGSGALTVKSQLIDEVEGAARVFVQAHGWRWLLPHSDGAAAALAVLLATGDDADWAWLAPRMESASDAQKALVAQHFEGAPWQAEVQAACAS